MAIPSSPIEGPEKRLRRRLSYFVNLSSIYTGMKYLFPGGQAALGVTGIMLGAIMYVELGGQFPWSKVESQPHTGDHKRQLCRPVRSLSLTFVIHTSLHSFYWT